MKKFKVVVRINEKTNQSQTIKGNLTFEQAQKVFSEHTNGDDRMLDVQKVFIEREK